MRLFLSITAIGLMAACAPQIPDSGLGFDNSEDAQRAREIALTGAGGTVIPPPVVSDEVVGTPEPFSVTRAPQSPGSTTTASSADIAAQTAAVLAGSSTAGGITVPAPSAVVTAPVPTQNNPGIPREQDFSAVSNQRSIQSDAARIEQNRQQYQVIQPTALPTRQGTGDPNIVNYALSTNHARGTRIYSRTGVNLAARAQRACAGYTSADRAQIDFLAKGGPERDRLGLDPDGDGYACAWNPAPFRAAVQN